MFEWIIFGTVMFIIGFFVAVVCVRLRCDGFLFVDGDELYLNLSEKDYKKIHSKLVKSIKIGLKRR